MDVGLLPPDKSLQPKRAVPHGSHSANIRVHVAEQNRNRVIASVRNGKISSTASPLKSPVEIHTGEFPVA